MVVIVYLVQQLMNGFRTKKIAHGEIKNQNIAHHFLRLQGIGIHKEFIPPGKTVNAVYYLGVMKRSLARIRRVRPECRESGSWRLLHDNAPSHRSTLVANFF